MPEIFRLLYGCGFRINEVTHLRFRDVDLKQGVLIIRGGKFDKDRLVPPAQNLVKRLRRYSARIEEATLKSQGEDDFFFPSPTDEAWSRSAIYTLFRQLLYQCGIHHQGRGKGPRLHDIRHTFAVHRMIQWFEEGCNINSKLPLLVAYLGHHDFTATQKYLHLTAELFPNLISRMNKQFGNVIPRRAR